jgi:hypothetical protein
VGQKERNQPNQAGCVDGRGTKSDRTSNTSSAWANKDEVSSFAKGESAPLIAWLMLHCRNNYK